jgi:hypothetical protein
MDLFVISRRIPRRMARLQYLTARLPFTVLDEYVVPPRRLFLSRLGLRAFLGSVDELAGFLLADGHISRRGHENLRSVQAAARQARGRRPKGSRSPSLIS